MKQAILDLFYIFREELRAIFSDSTIIVLFFVGTLLYPLLYSWIYNNEVLHDSPIAVVDNNNSSTSREYLRQLDATPELQLAYYCTNMEEARKLVEERKAHGIVYIPATFTNDIKLGRQTTVSVYADMSSFLYYKGILAATSYVSQAEGGAIQVKQLMAKGESIEQAMATVNPIPATFTPLFNPGGGYASFLIPAVLVLVIHQTLLLGICILAGISRERNKLKLLVPFSKRYHGTIRIVGGKALAYLSVYIVLIFYVLFLVPRWFGLPHMGNLLHLYLFLLPFLFATIFLGMTISVFFRDRETPILMLLFLSVPLLFLSGVAWPLEDMPAFWQLLANLLPSTHGVQGFIKISTMGADLYQVRYEYFALCVQLAVYLTTCYWMYRRRIRQTERHLLQQA